MMKCKLQVRTDEGNVADSFTDKKVQLTSLQQGTRIERLEKETLKDHGYMAGPESVRDHNTV